MFCYTCGSQDHARHPVIPREPGLFDRPDAAPRDPAVTAARLASDAGKMRDNLLRAYRDRSMTAEEAADACGYTADDGAWRRVSDLVGMGLLAPMAVTHRARSGRDQRLLRITEIGKEALGA